MEQLWVLSSATSRETSGRGGLDGGRIGRWEDLLLSATGLSGEKMKQDCFMESKRLLTTSQASCEVGVNNKIGRRVK
jgi:hypothetical protein